MTPCHDPNDFEVGLRHDLEQILDLRRGRHASSKTAASMHGLDRYEARKAIVADLEEQGYLIKTEPYNHNVGTLLPLRHDGRADDELRAVVRQDEAAGRSPPSRPCVTDDIKFVPERFSKTYYQLDGERPRLVHLPSALVGPSDPGVVLRRLRPCHRLARTDACECEACGSKHIHQRSRRARHLVLLRALAVLHPRLAGYRRRGSQVLLSDRRAGDGL